jgi:hypothetical protein
MRRRFWLILAGAVFGTVVLLLAVGLVGLYFAARQAPEFYEKALQADPVAQAKASDEMLQQATALASDVKAEGRWHGLFTEEQINGWLAVDLIQNHPTLLPWGVSDPRVNITPQEVTVACRVRRRKIDSVVTLSVDAYVAEPNVVALRVRGARAGLLPLPLPRILEEIAENARRLDLAVQWQHVEGDPVALISIPPPRDERDKRVCIEKLHLGKGEIYLAGRTESSSGPDGPSEESDLSRETSEKVNDQR